MLQLGGASVSTSRCYRAFVWCTLVIVAPTTVWLISLEREGGHNNETLALGHLLWLVDLFEFHLVQKYLRTMANLENIMDLNNTFMHKHAVRMLAVISGEQRERSTVGKSWKAVRKLLGKARLCCCETRRSDSTGLEMLHISSRYVLQLWRVATVMLGLLYLLGSVVPVWLSVSGTHTVGFTSSMQAHLPGEIAMALANTLAQMFHMAHDIALMVCLTDHIEVTVHESLKPIIKKVRQEDDTHGKQCAKIG
eukprot:g2658.t1